MSSAENTPGPDQEKAGTATLNAPAPPPACLELVNEVEMFYHAARAKEAQDYTTASDAFAQAIAHAKELKTFSWLADGALADLRKKKREAEEKAKQAEKKAEKESEARQAIENLTQKLNDEDFESVKGKAKEWLKSDALSHDTKRKLTALVKLGEQEYPAALEELDKIPLDEWVGEQKEYALKRYATQLAGRIKRAKNNAELDELSKEVENRFSEQPEPFKLLSESIARRRAVLAYQSSLQSPVPAGPELSPVEPDAGDAPAGFAKRQAQRQAAAPTQPQPAAARLYDQARRDNDWPGALDALNLAKEHNMIRFYSQVDATRVDVERALERLSDLAALIAEAEKFYPDSRAAEREAFYAALKGPRLQDALNRAKAKLREHKAAAPAGGAAEAPAKAAVQRPGRAAAIEKDGPDATGPDPLSEIKENLDKKAYAEALKSGLELQRRLKTYKASAAEPLQNTLRPLLKEALVGLLAGGDEKDDEKDIETARRGLEEANLGEDSKRDLGQWLDNHSKVEALRQNAAQTKDLAAKKEALEQAAELSAGLHPAVNTALEKVKRDLKAMADTLSQAETAFKDGQAGEAVERLQDLPRAENDLGKKIEEARKVYQQVARWQNEQKAWLALPDVDADKTLAELDAHLEMIKPVSPLPPACAKEMLAKLEEWEKKAKEKAGSQPGQFGPLGNYVWLNQLRRQLARQTAPATEKAAPLACENPAFSAPLRAALSKVNQAERLDALSQIPLCQRPARAAQIVKRYKPGFGEQIAFQVNRLKTAITDALKSLKPARSVKVSGIQVGGAASGRGGAHKWLTRGGIVSVIVLFICVGGIFAGYGWIGRNIEQWVSLGGQPSSPVATEAPAGTTPPTLTQTVDIFSMTPTSGSATASPTGTWTPTPAAPTAAPTPSPTLTPTPTDSATPTPETVYWVRTSATIPLALRTEPSIRGGENTVLERLEAGQTVRALELPPTEPDADGIRWLRVYDEASESAGWMSAAPQYSNYTKVSQDENWPDHWRDPLMDELGIVDTATSPPTPSPTPAPSVSPAPAAVSLKPDLPRADRQLKASPGGEVVNQSPLEQGAALTILAEQDDGEGNHWVKARGKGEDGQDIEGWLRDWYTTRVPILRVVHLKPGLEEFERTLRLDRLEDDAPPAEEPLPDDQTLELRVLEKKEDGHGETWLWVIWGNPQHPEAAQEGWLKAARTDFE